MQDSDPTQPKASYHHGDLRNALLAAAEVELSEKGVEGFSLRGVAKRAGVSHAAPAHHFHDTSGMLTELAAIASERLKQCMVRRQAETDGSPRARFIASGVGYVEFAVGNPALFKLMFGSEKPDMSNVDLKLKASSAFMLLVNDVAALTGKNPMADDEGMLQVASAWSIVHGLSNLVIANRIGFLQPMLSYDLAGTVERVISRIVPG